MFLYSQARCLAVSRWTETVLSGDNSNSNKEAPNGLPGFWQGDFIRDETLMIVDYRPYEKPGASVFAVIRIEQSPEYHMVLSQVPRKWRHFGLDCATW
jgi:hypothetical protein